MYNPYFVDESFKYHDTGSYPESILGEW